MNTPPVLVLDQIVKRFQGTVALGGVSFDLRAGEIHALVGENGAGKSTLMKILGGSYAAGDYEGTIELAGRPARFRNPLDAERAGIAMIHQELSLHLDLSIAENIHLGILPVSRWGLVDRSRMLQVSRELLERVGLAESPQTTLRQLSASRQQLVAIAKALARRPRILILDEPTSALTETEAERLLLLIEQFRDGGLSCIYISHKMDEVFRIADRLTVLRDGRAIATYLRGEASRDQIIQDMIGRRLEPAAARAALNDAPVILRVEGLTVPHPYTPQKRILDGVGFSLRRGEVLGLAGLVGAGRTELVHALFGVAGRPQVERLELDGCPLEIRGPHDAIAAGIGLLTEDRRRNGFVGTMNIRQNITLASLRDVAAWGTFRPELEQAAALRFIDQLSIRATGSDASILSLSGGNQQKVVLAKWLMRPLKVLLLDEPTRGIDVGSKAQIYTLIRQLAESGLGIIMISSELPELLATCDRFLVLAGGHIQDEFGREQASIERIMHAATRN